MFPDDLVKHQEPSKAVKGRGGEPYQLFGDPSAASILDAAHGGGNPHFFFLPPMVTPAPVYTGIFDGEADPTVEICEWSELDGCTATVISFAVGSGLTVNPGDEWYGVDWYVFAHDPADGDIFRITVSASNQPLGFADLMIVEKLTGQVKKSVGEEYIYLSENNGKKFLKIRFRVEEGAAYWNLLKVDFDYDVFAEGWFRSDPSVAVDLTGEVLLIGTGSGILGDWAQVPFHADLPITVESRMRLVSYGRNYLLPHFTVGYGSSMNEGIITTYLPDLFGHGWGLGPATDRWTYSTENGPGTEGVWVTLTLEVRTDGGRLFSRLDGQSTETLVASKAWSIPAQTTELYFIQPWDAVCEFDYIYGRSGLAN